MDYTEMTKQYQELQRQRNAIGLQMAELQKSMRKMEEEKAQTVFNEILNRLSVLTSLGYVIDVKFWDNDRGDWDWDENALGVSDNLRLRHKDTVII